MSNILRILILLVFLIHALYLLFDAESVTYYDGYYAVWAEYAWYAVQVLLLCSLVGLFFLVKVSRYFLIVALSLSLTFVYAQGSTLYAPAYHVMVQVGSGIYGAILSMVFCSNIVWRQKGLNNGV